MTNEYEDNERGQIHAHLPLKLKNEFKCIAEEQGESLSTMTRIAIKEFCERYEKEKEVMRDG